MEDLSPQRRQARIAAISFLFYHHQRAWTKCEELAGDPTNQLLDRVLFKTSREQAVFLLKLPSKRLHESD